MSINAMRKISDGGRWIGIVAGLCLCLTAAACELNLLKQEAPSRVEASTVADPSNATLLVRSAVSQFQCALGLHVYATGLVSDELSHGSLIEVLWDYDRRTLSASRGQYAEGGCGTGVPPANYTALSSARFLADNVLQLLEGWTDAQVPNRTELIAKAAAYAGYSLVLLGESMCSVALDVGPELSRDQVFAEAVDRFDRAIQAAKAAGTETILNLARVGRARALRDLGRLQEAAADAALVPKGFIVRADYSDISPRRRNRLFVVLSRNAFSTVDAEYRNLGDPRVRVIDTGRTASDASVPLFIPAKYDEVTDPIPIATWEEAQLIIAEAALAAGNPQAAVDIINILHAQAGLPPFQSNDPAEIMDHLIQERARALFLEGHRLYDLIRYDLPLMPPPGTPFPLGGEYGDQLCFPLPIQETGNNPNI